MTPGGLYGVKDGSMDFLSPHTLAFVKGVRRAQAEWLQSLGRTADEMHPHLVSALVNKPALFFFLDRKLAYFSGVIGESTLSVQFVPKRVTLDPSGSLSEAFAGVFRKFDTVCCLLDHCRLDKRITVIDYHQQLRELDGSSYWAFRRLRNAAAKEVRPPVVSDSSKVSP